MHTIWLNITSIPQENISYDALWAHLRTRRADASDSIAFVIRKAFTLSNCKASLVGTFVKAFSGGLLSLAGVNLEELIWEFKEK
jgi:hypothetical protein